MTTNIEYKNERRNAHRIENNKAAIEYVRVCDGLAIRLLPWFQDGTFQVEMDGKPVFRNLATKGRKRKHYTINDDGRASQVWVHGLVG